MEVPTYRHSHAMTVLIRTFLTDREKLNELAIHLIWSFGTYTEPQGLKKNPNVVYATNILKITIFKSVWKTVPEENKILFCMLSNTMMICGTNFLNTLYSDSNTKAEKQMGHIMRKPVYGICEQQRRRSACTSAQSDQPLCCSLPE